MKRVQIQVFIFQVRAESLAERVETACQVLSCLVSDLGRSVPERSLVADLGR